MNITLPPAIRLFISSTFADMSRERQYFNTIIVPKVQKMCIKRGVSFFSVDLRWGITEEDQMQGNVLPICLREIDNCRPFFIGIIGDRYGSILEDITPETKASFPWLNDQMGKSVTELEMYYGVLQYENENRMDNCAFFFRSHRLSKQFFTETESENKLEKLNLLKDAIRTNVRIPAYDYDALEEFEQQVLSVVSHWLDALFPSVKSIHDARKDWYNSELLRDYVNLESMQNFLDNYCQNSTRSLMVYGEGPRGKTTALTAWTPANGKKILINCAADESYQYWPTIALKIVNMLQELDQNVGFPEFEAYATLYFRMVDIFQLEEQSDESTDQANSTMYFVTDEDRESFRKGFVDWLNKIVPQTSVYIVINDLNLLEDTNAAFLNWLPNKTQTNVHLICTVNDEAILKTAQAMGWNTKEMPLLSHDSAMHFLNTYMAVFGKKLSHKQLTNLENTPLFLYPGHQRQIVQYYNNYGNFENLDEMTAKMGQMRTEADLDRFMLDNMMSTLSSQEILAAQNALYILTTTCQGLQESDLFNMVQALSPIDAIGWSRVRVFPEQFQLITADAWKIWNATMRVIVEHFPVDTKSIHCLLGSFFLNQMDKVVSRTSEGIKRNTDCAKAALYHYAEAEEWETLVGLLQDWKILYYLTKMEWATVRSMWMRILMFSNIDVSEKLKEIFVLCDRNYEKIEGIRQRILGLMSDLELWDVASWASDRSGLPKISSLRNINTGKLSKENIQVYNRFVELKEKRHFLGLLGAVNAFLEDHENRLNPNEKCCFFILKLDAEIQLGNFQNALAASYQYYSAAVAATDDYEILRAVLSRGEILYFSERYSETGEALKYARKLALSLGAIREYLASLNMEGMCNYRQAMYKEAIICFDICMRTWKRMGNDQEYVTCWLNKTNALQLSGDFTEAARDLELLLKYIKTCREHEKLIFQEARVLCNLARVYDMQGKVRESEVAYKKAIAVSAGRSDSTPNAYYGLIDLYKRLEQYTKEIDIYKQLFDYLYQRNLYPALAKAIKDCIEIMQVGNYTHEAQELQKKWEAIFDQISGGRALMEKAFSEAVDQQLEDQLWEQLAVAQSETDYEKCGELLTKIADYANDQKNLEACDLYMKAIDAFSAAGNQEKAAECAASAIGLLIRQAGTDTRFDRIYSILSPEDKELVNLWHHLIDIADSKEKYNEEISQLMAHSSPNNPITVICLTSEVERIMEKATTDLLVRIVEWMKAGVQYNNFEYAIEKVAQKDFLSDIDFLRRHYMGDRADYLLEYAEKRISVLEALDSKDAGAVAGNIALIYRRRLNKEQTIQHHEQALRIYRNHNELRDMFIEQMNLATAYKEFGEPEKALSQLRDMMNNPDLKQYGDIRAAVAGNLASFLISMGVPDVKEEILTCFSIEESYFENAGEVRELVISLINQLQFDRSNHFMNQDERRKKYLQAEELSKKYHLREFIKELRKLRILIMDERDEESKKKTNFFNIMDIIKKAKGKKNSMSPRECLDQLFENNSDYKVAKIDEETGSNLHALLYPKEINPLMIVNVHLWINCEDGYTVKYLFAAQPKLMRDNLKPVIKQYIDWWNEQEDYELSYESQEDDVVILATSLQRTLNWKDVVREYRRIEEFWKVDTLCFSMSIIGLDNLEDFQKMKKAIMENKV